MLRHRIDSLPPDHRAGDLSPQRLKEIGLAIGLAGSLWLTRLLQSQLFNVDAVDPTTLVAIVGILSVVAVVAVFIPASRASRSDPISSLRAE